MRGAVSALLFPLPLLLQGTSHWGIMRKGPGSRHVVAQVISPPFSSPWDAFQEAGAPGYEQALRTAAESRAERVSGLGKQKHPPSRPGRGRESTAAPPPAAAGLLLKLFIWKKQEYQPGLPRGIREQIDLFS